MLSWAVFHGLADATGTGNGGLTPVVLQGRAWGNYVASGDYCCPAALPAAPLSVPELQQLVTVTNAAADMVYLVRVGQAGLPNEHNYVLQYRAADTSIRCVVWALSLSLTHTTHMRCV
jgi:hypothetical protein